MRKILFLLILFHVTSAGAQVDLSGLKFCLDPGHGDYPNVKPFETRINLPVANFLKTYLEEYGAWVITTRQDSAAKVSLWQREYIANSNNVDFFHSIHHNAFKGNANYTLMLYEEKPTGQPEWPGESDVMSNFMADYLHSYLYTTGKYVRGDLSFLGFNLGVLNDLTMPGVLSEASFWDYVPEVHRLNSMEYLKLEAFAFLYAYLDYYGVPKRQSSFVEGVVRNTEGENLPDVTVTITNGVDEMVYITDSRNIGITDQDRNWTGFPYITEVRNGMFFFENFPSGQAQIILEGEKLISDTVAIVVKDTTSSRVDPIELISTVPPYVVSTTPAQGDTNFPAWDDIIIDFSRKMDRASVETTFVIIPEIEGTITWSNDDTRMTFHTDTLNFETNYTITISGSAKDIYGHPFDGNADGIGGDDFILEFKTGPPDMTPPKLVSIYPPQYGQNIELQPLINATYDEQLEPSSVSENIFKLERFYDHSTVFGTLEHYVVNDRSVLCFFPSAKLFPNEIYVTRIYPGLRDLFGNEVHAGKAFRFTTSNYDYDITLIDDFESGVTSNWWSPQSSGNTTGIITDSTSRDANSEIINLLTGSTKSLEVKYGWDTEASSWLIRVYLVGGAPKDVWFNSGYIMQVYIFGDGSGNKFRFCVDDNVPNYTAANHEVSPWYTVDWIGWRLVSWDMTNDTTGTWIGDGNLDGTLRFDSIQLTYEPGSSASGTFYFDDLRLVKKVPVSVDEPLTFLPAKFALYQNYPNPFNPETTIRYQVSSSRHRVVLAVYDVLGEKVRTLVNEEQPAGEYLIRWDGRDDNGNNVASGTYFYKLSAGGFTQTRRMVLVK